MIEIFRATVAHTPSDHALLFHEDGGLAVADGRIAARGDFAELSRAYPSAVTRDLRGGFLLPGFIDTHIHFSQMRVLGALGYSLLDWLHEITLPEEARMADVEHARSAAGEFVHALAASGTTTALVFSGHFAAAAAVLFQAAQQAGIRMAAGLTLSDRLLRPELHHTPDAAYRESEALIREFHGKGKMLYAVTPRFALSASEPMLEACRALLRAHPGVRLQTHLNENAQEIAEVARLFPWAHDYLEVYEKFDLVGRYSVLAHSVHTSGAALERIARRGASVSHCPCSNAALGSGIFPFRKHLDAGVRCALGTDVGGGTGFGLLKEALQAHLLQRLAPEPMVLRPEYLLYLATRAGAEALGIEDETGDFQAGKSADFVYLRPSENSAFASVLRQADTPARVLGAIFTLAGAESVREVRVAGSVVYRSIP